MTFLSQTSYTSMKNCRIASSVAGAVGFIVVVVVVDVAVVLVVERDAAEEELMPGLLLVAVEVEEE